MKLSTAAALVLLPLAAAQGEIRSIADLNFDDNGKLAKHNLLYPTGKCAELIEAELSDVYGYEFHAVSGDAEAAFLKGYCDFPSTTNPVESIDDCRAVCLERGVDRSVVTTPMHSRKFRGVHEQQDFGQWFEWACRYAEVGVINYHSKTPLNMYWADETGERKDLVKTIEYGEKNTVCFTSYIGHWLEFEDIETKEVVYKHRVEFVSILGIGEAPPHETKITGVADKVRKILDVEWERTQSIKRTFSPLGFKKGRLPDILWASMGAFYYNNRNYMLLEEQNKESYFVNWWDSDVYFVQVPWGLRDSWQGLLRELVEAWVGEPLEQTFMYGMRRYQEGARLLTHGDRQETHAASLIVNIAQGNLSEPWPIEVHDHAGRLHQVTMEPGDIVYYESASGLHGRNTPLKGEGAYYVNLFTHYRPRGDPEWQYKPNKPDQATPLLDVGECRLEGTIDMIGQGAVKCDNPAIGPYLSPHLFTATSGKDLFDWWVKVSPESEDTTLKQDSTDEVEL